MFPFKRFLQGPNLHEESVALAESQQRFSDPSSTSPLSGEQARNAYEEILKTTSTSANKSDNQKASTSTSNKARPSRPKNSEPTKKLTLNELMRLCETNQESKLEMYIQSSFFSAGDIDEQDIYGWTLLMSAACAGSNNCLKLLLRYGASLYITDKKGLTAVDHAKMKGKRDILEILEEWRRVGGTLMLMGLEDEYDEDEKQDPIFCDACNQTFNNQRTHIKSIAHLLSSGQFQNSEGKVHYGIPESNKGFQMMLKTGWNQSSGLGPDGKGQRFPVKTVLKRDREGVGNEKDRKAAKITHFGPFDPAAVEGRLRTEREATVEKQSDEKKRRHERRKEINFRRELNLL